MRENDVDLILTCDSYPSMISTSRILISGGEIGGWVNPGRDYKNMGEEVHRMENWLPFLNEAHDFCQ